MTLRLRGSGVKPGLQFDREAVSHAANPVN
jgi:hypothetical protein